MFLKNWSFIYELTKIILSIFSKRYSLSLPNDDPLSDNGSLAICKIIFFLVFSFKIFAI